MTWSDHGGTEDAEAKGLETKGLAQRREDAKGKEENLVPKLCLGTQIREGLLRLGE